MEGRRLTIEKLCRYSRQTHSLITADVPLFGTTMILEGKLLAKGSAIEPEKIGRTAGFPPDEKIVELATRFWVMDPHGVRRVHDRAQMLKLIS